MLQIIYLIGMLIIVGLFFLLCFSIAQVAEEGRKTQSKIFVQTIETILQSNHFNNL